MNGYIINEDCLTWYPYTKMNVENEEIAKFYRQLRGALIWDKTLLSTHGISLKTAYT